ncbi:MAG TPA: YdbL family protein [Alphaproteobacteria bacterium]|nr:YdbL family protein [Alphaproteobacteria bacterium]
MIRRVPILLSLLGALMIAPHLALAGPLDKPKQEGLIGERPDGYVGFVADEVPADIKKLVDRTNQERRNEYEQVAKETGTAREAVEAIFGEKLIARQPPGTYVMTADGKWIKK